MSDETKEEIRRLIRQTIREELEIIIERKRLGPDSVVEVGLAILGDEKPFNLDFLVEGL